MLGRFIRSSDGAVMPYVALILVVLLGLVGLGLDFGQQFSMRSELQKAADAAAVAGAAQLDRTADPGAVAARVAEAVAGAALTENRTKTANAPGEVVIADHRLLQSIPADDDAPIGSVHDGPPYTYVEVTTAVSSQDFSLLRLFGGTVLDASATAVAGRGRAVCSITPLMLCNPLEDPVNGGGSFDPTDFIGNEVLAGSGRGSGRGGGGGGGGDWAPGNFGFLSLEDSGADALREALSSVNGADQCFDLNEGLTSEPGRMTQQVRRGINSRFGEDRDYPSAENIQSYPHDTDLRNPNTVPPARIGNGDWDAARYWNDVHGQVPPQPGITRWETYRWEIDQGRLPTTPPPGGAPPPGSTVHIPATPHDDRRIITMAVVNCIENEPSRRQPTGSVGFVKAFLTSPIPNPPNDDFYFEIIGGSANGKGGLVPVPVRDWVEVKR